MKTHKQLILLRFPALLSDSKKSEDSESTLFGKQNIDFLIFISTSKAALKSKLFSFFSII